jgi:cardiolipin synthase A/B
MESLLGEIAAKQFHQRIIEERKSFPKLNKVSFPSFGISDDGDAYFQQLWRGIDSANKYIWVIMYHFDDTRIGQITLNKLTQAALRGVNVCVMHDVLTSELHQGLAREFKEAGGLEYRLNPMYRIWNIPSRRYFKRDHEKIIIADEKIYLGSGNISVDYARNDWITQIRSMELTSSTI